MPVAEDPVEGPDVVPLYRLQVAVEPEDSGRVYKYPDKTWYKAGDVVVLRAVPNLREGYQFDHWTGAEGGAMTRIVMNGHRRVMAHFIKREVTLLLDTRP